MRLVRSPVAQFLLLAVLTMLAILVGTTWIATGVAEDEAIAEATNTTEVLAEAIAGPQVSEGLVEARAGAIDRFGRYVRENVLLDGVERVNIWRSDGKLIYTDRNELSGVDFRLNDEQERTLRTGVTGHQDADPDDPEYPDTDRARKLIRVYTPIPGTNSQLLFEAYFALEPIDERREAIISPFRRMIVGSLLALFLIVTPILWLLTRRLTRAGEERERLLVHAADASDAERRRIARDLHDGVVQDIAGTTFSLTALARDPDVPAPARETLDGAGDALRDSLRALRSLLAEIHPPDLHADGLEPALGDLIAPAVNAGIQASVSVSGIEGASDTAVALVWRVAQEAVRNALRHSGASTVAVTVQGVGDRLRLEVVDDGVGFDPAVADPDRYGLKGLRSLVKDIGGEIDVVSALGEGTTVRMEVARQ
ncbi:sensor histidine kinase [Nocardioides marmotae]|uniref:sensor histidine kinase n=1 Tax=Nocardioides marmotae TaxID=2663857 RepID=UPI0012B65A9D|nr:sensor histidine kinase [Nocardioides marmotae]MBC9733863.1 sensor histidine kinase [Nocardioides marmotae]MTB84966.1 hypothetical protein [Nocardioides marmotae]